MKKRWEMVLMYFFVYRSTPFEQVQKFTTNPCIDLDFNDFCVALDQEGREGRGSVSYTDYYSNEDGQIRRTGGDISLRHLRNVYGCEDLPLDHENDEEDYTVTLRQAEEQKKQDVKFIFEPKEKEEAVKGKNYKKIGR